MLRLLSFVGGSSKGSVFRQFLKNNQLISFSFKYVSKRAFSIAEAMITFLIVSVVLAAAAPMMTKRAKPHIEPEKENPIPKGAIMFFDSAYVEKESDANPCPKGWRLVDSKYNGRYFRVAGDYNICDKSGEDSDGACVGTVATSITSNNPGTLAGDAIRNLTGSFSAYEVGRWSYVKTEGVFTAEKGTYNGTSGHDGKAPKFIFNAANTVPTATENRPKSVSMLTCVKVDN